MTPPNYGVVIGGLGSFRNGFLGFGDCDSDSFESLSLLHPGSVFGLSTPGFAASVFDKQE